MSVHTPGPWFGRPHHDPVMISGSSEVGLEIAFSCAGAGSRREEYKANARLIAAAPELLEAGQRWIRAALDSNEGITADEKVALDAMVSAVAKATGETP